MDGRGVQGIDVRCSVTIGDRLKYDKTSFFKQCQNILTLLNNHTSSWPFKKPVNLEEVPDYADRIKRPMDLETMEKRLETRELYLSKETFRRDLHLIFDNAKSYNKPNTIYYRYAVNLEEYIKPHVEKMTEPTEMELQELAKLAQTRKQQVAKTPRGKVPTPK